MTICAILLAIPEPHDAVRIASGDHAILHAPFGLGWFLEEVPFSAVSAKLAYRMYVTCGALALVGLYTRLSLLGLLASAFYLLGIRQLTGVVLHDMHLLWLLALLVSTRDVRHWSADAILGRAKSASSKSDASAFLVLARTMLGLVYFFPGLWKLREQGLAWASAENLQTQLWAKWYQHGTVPNVRLDLHPTLLHVLGLATVAFELGFVFLVHVGPKTRLLLGIAGISFHLCIEHFMLIPFSSLWLCYVVLLGKERGLAPIRSLWKPRPRSKWLLLAGASLTLGAIVAGFQGTTQAFPFACYPTFQSRVDSTLPDMILTVTSPDGSETVVPVRRDTSGGRSQEDWGAIWSVLGVYGTPRSGERLSAFLKQEVATMFPTPIKTRVEIGYFSTRPEDRARPALRRVPVYASPP